jgi:5-methylcytosine-specific restriction endonuclease McrA
MKHARPFEFARSTKQQAFFRQWNLCAHCGRSLVNVMDHAHHVVPNQLGRASVSGDAWIREVDNCVILCDICHDRVHEDGRFRTGAVASPADFPYTHGNQLDDHKAWAARMQHLFWRK